MNKFFWDIINQPPVVIPGRCKDTLQLNASAAFVKSNVTSANMGLVDRLIDSQCRTWIMKQAWAMIGSSPHYCSQSASIASILLLNAQRS